MVEANFDYGEAERKVQDFSEDEAARILAHMDATNQANLELARKASEEEKQCAKQVKNTNQTRIEMKQFQEKYDRTFKELTQKMVQSELKKMPPGRPFWVMQAT